MPRSDQLISPPVYTSQQDEDRFRPRCRPRLLGRCLRPGFILLLRRSRPELRRQRLGPQHGHGAHLHHGASVMIVLWHILRSSVHSRQWIGIGDGENIGSLNGHRGLQ